ncbi:MAG: tRNA (N6-threonylcarbamoyladenosine(37)-N6)-methyltransferase TrmO [Bacteroidota bacterium]|nr:tRNA (N6-threonylcarbamoyladenosine(37)-N6)-methyltransferase TrmO [Candidatus Kapabacteria bacterium]MDW8219629.1 tRNA (N6-threonylcarbamoyladenosine(37)-N6)-methyltransferase TrmO [Bacteroidota bacterium]
MPTSIGVGSKMGNPTITLFPHRNFEQALSDIEGFERIWVLYVFHRNVRMGKSSWKPKVLPPHGRVKRGVFATRAPYRPNPLGLSVVRLLSIQGRILAVTDCDMLDATPVLDIKPYIPTYDAFPTSCVGWLDDIAGESFVCEYTAQALAQLEQALCECPALSETVCRTLHWHSTHFHTRTDVFVYVMLLCASMNMRIKHGVSCIVLIRLDAVLLLHRCGMRENKVYSHF